MINHWETIYPQIRHVDPFLGLTHEEITISRLPGSSKENILVLGILDRQLILKLIPASKASHQYQELLQYLISRAACIPHHYLLSSNINIGGTQYWIELSDFHEQTLLPPLSFTDFERLIKAIVNLHKILKNSPISKSSLANHESFVHSIRLSLDKLSLDKKLENKVTSIIGLDKFKFLNFMINSLPDRQAFPETHQVIHGDMHPGNILINPHHIKFIDFENSCKFYESPTYDIANVFQRFVLNHQPTSTQIKECLDIIADNSDSNLPPANDINYYLHYISVKLTGIIFTKIHSLPASIIRKELMKFIQQYQIALEYRNLIS